jgi:hypothetical protein
MIYVFLFFECFKHMDPFLWNILNLKQFGEQLIKENYFWYKKITCPQLFLNVLNIQKDSWNMVNFHGNFVVATLKV